MALAETVLVGFPALMVIGRKRSVVSEGRDQSPDVWAGIRA
jgi:hypothetical protein